MPTYTADTADTRLTKYGADNDLTRTFEYCEKAVTADAYDGTRIELLIDLLIRDQTANIEGSTITADEISPLPVGMKVVRTHQLMEAFKAVDERGELHPWIIEELDHLRRFTEAVSLLGLDNDY